MNWQQKLKQFRQAFVKRNFWQLKLYSTEWIREAAASNNPTTAELAVLAYACYKMQSKDHIVQNPKWEKARADVLEAMDRADKWLSQNNTESFRQSLQSVEKILNAIDQKLGNYFQTTVKKAKIKMASSAYAFGMSLQQSAILTGAEADDVQAYVGITKMHDETPVVHGISQRLKKFEEGLS